MKIYLDEDFCCHTSSESAVTTIETDFFDEKAPGYIEGYRFVPAGESWTREDGAVFAGEMASPWKDWTELDAVQREYEREQYNDLITKLSEVYEDA